MRAMAKAAEGERTKPRSKRLSAESRGGAFLVDAPPVVKVVDGPLPMEALEFGSVVVPVDAPDSGLGEQRAEEGGGRSYERSLRVHSNCIRLR
jgi:hypothetical protein